MYYDFAQLSDGGHSGYALEAILRTAGCAAASRKVGLETFISTDNSNLQYVFHDTAACRQYAASNTVLASQPNPGNRCFYRTEHIPEFTVFKQSKDALCEEDTGMIPVIRSFFDAVAVNAYLAHSLSFPDSFLEALRRLSGYENVSIPLEAYGRTFYCQAAHLYSVLKFHGSNYLLVSIDPNNGYTVCRPIVRAALTERFTLNCKTTLIVSAQEIQHTSIRTAS